MAESIYKFLMQDALSTGGGQDDALKDKKGDMEKEDNRRTNKKSLQQQIGIQLTLAGILKQSAIFTGFIGSLFQIVGAFVDTLLMGIFPLLKGGLKFIMKFFDPIKKAAAGIGTIIEFVMKIFSNMPKLPGRDSMDLPGEIGNPLSDEAAEQRKEENRKLREEQERIAEEERLSKEEQREKPLMHLLLSPEEKNPSRAHLFLWVKNLNKQHN